ncbi:retrovirus-related Pol polyprotein from transposon 17.6 [Trichonephila clavipes]|nr:retrovirus-related Pol polyprotein from transposon 17.6 [Trichonephila clavipes]
MVVDQLKKRANASMKDHFLDNWANLKSATQIAELFDNYEDVRKVNSKPMDRGRNFNTCTPGICSGISAAKGYARKFKLIVKLELRDPIKSLCHEGTSAHLGITKSKDKFNRYFYWPNCYRDMERFVKTCDQCQRAGKPNDKKKAPLKLVPVIQEVFTKLNIDACGPLPITSKGYRYLITAICMSSKFPEAIPVSDISSVSVTDALLNIFSRMRFPREIQCDQGTSFTSALTTEFFKDSEYLSGIVLCIIHRVTLLSDFIER